MNSPTVIDAATAAQILSHATGESYQLSGALVGGESGAHKFLGPNDVPFVIKWETSSAVFDSRVAAVARSEELRNIAHWPVPTERIVRADNVLFVIQEFMAGSTPTSIDHHLVDQLISLHPRRLNLADADGTNTWATHLIETLTTGGSGYCVHGSFRSHDSRTKSLIERIERFGETLDPSLLGGNDIVHWDLHPGNLLVRREGLSAIVDTDFACVGDARFDLVFLAISSLAMQCGPDVRARLNAAAFDQLDDVRTQAYLAHCFVRIIDWPIRRGNFNEVEFWLAKADELLTL